MAYLLAVSPHIQLSQADAIFSLGGVARHGAGAHTSVPRAGGSDPTLLRRLGDHHGLHHGRLAELFQLHHPVQCVEAAKLKLN